MEISELTLDQLDKVNGGLDRRDYLLYQTENSKTFLKFDFAGTVERTAAVLEDIYNNVVVEGSHQFWNIGTVVKAITKF